MIYMDILANERWGDYPDYEGLYLISDFGRVASYYQSKTTISTNKTKIIKSPNGGRYKHNTLCKDGIRKTKLLHQAVAKVFVNNPSVGLFNQVNHIDGNKHNNHYTNLEWCTAKMNITHAFKNGLITTKKGEDSKTSRFSNFDVSRIKVFIKNNIPLRTISKVYGCHESLISAIKIGRSWSHII